MDLGVHRPSQPAAVSTVEGTGQSVADGFAAAGSGKSASRFPSDFSPSDFFRKYAKFTLPVVAVIAACVNLFSIDSQPETEWGDAYPSDPSAYTDYTDESSIASWMENGTGIILDSNWTDITDANLIAEGKALNVFIHNNGCRLIVWGSGSLENADITQEATLPWALPTGFESAFSPDGSELSVAYASDTQTTDEWYGSAMKRTLVTGVEDRVGTAILLAGATNYLLCTVDYTLMAEGYDYDLRFEEAMLPVIQSGISIL